VTLTSPSSQTPWSRSRSPRSSRRSAPNGRREYSLEHPLTQEVAYASQLSEPRARRIASARSPTSAWVPRPLAADPPLRIAEAAVDAADLGALAAERGADAAPTHRAPRCCPPGRRAPRRTSSR
jgi:hypothetical protein